MEAFCACGQEFRNLDMLIRHQERVEANGGDHWYHIDRATSYSRPGKRQRSQVSHAS